MAGERIEIPLVIGGQDDPRRGDGEGGHAARPRPRARRLAQGHEASTSAQAIEAAAAARREWASWPWEDRAAVFLRAAELLATTWRATVNAATMLGQSKTAFQAEIDSAAELIDFWRFNPHYAQELYAEQPLSNPTMWNQLDYRPLEGFVYAVTPFNFTSIAGNLPDRARPHGQHRRLEAGLLGRPERVLHPAAARGGGPAARASSTSCPATRPPSPRSSSTTATSPGVHFTGSTEVFNSMWRTIGAQMDALPLVPADRGRDRGQGLHRGPRLGRPRRPSRSRSCGAASSTRGRSARPRAASTSRGRSGTTCATGSSP